MRADTHDHSVEAADFELRDVGGADAVGLDLVDVDNVAVFLAWASVVTRA